MTCWPTLIVATSSVSPLPPSSSSGLASRSHSPMKRKSPSRAAAHAALIEAVCALESASSSREASRACRGSDD